MHDLGEYPIPRDVGIRSGHSYPGAEAAMITELASRKHGQHVPYYLVQIRFVPRRGAHTLAPNVREPQAGTKRDARRKSTRSGRRMEAPALVST